MEYTQIKSYEDACTAINYNPELLPDVSMLSKEDADFILSIFKLTKITKAINGEWEADFGNHDQRKYFPWFFIEEGYSPGSGGGFSCHYYDCSYSTSTVGARLSFSDWERAKYAAETFIDLYEHVHLIIK